MKPTYLLAIPLLAGLILTACGGDDNDDDEVTPPPTPTPQLAIKGNVKGLSDTVKLELQKNGQAVETLLIQSDGTDKAFTFPTMQDEGINFAITVNTQPVAQTCSVTNGSGTLNATTAVATLVTCEDNPNAELTGILRDSPVAGINYQTETKESGITSDIGEYQYLKGEHVTFSVGAIMFPATAAASLITPTEIAAGNEITKVNILQLLQTLDKDCDVENGIQVKATSHELLADIVLDITSADFDANINAAFTTKNSGLTLISETQALTHFDSSNRNLLLGSWLFTEGEGQRTVLTFKDHSSYIMIHEHESDGGQSAASVEYGHYTWDSQTGSFSVSIIAQSDGSGGFYDEGSTVNNATVNLDKLTVSFIDNTEGDITLTRIEDKNDPLIGTWHVLDTEADNDSFVTFLPNQNYVIAHTANTDSYEGKSPQAQSGEFGRYIKDASGYKFTATVESDGPNGLYSTDSPDDYLFSSIKITAWGEMIAVQNGAEGGTFSLDYIGGFVSELVDKPSSAAGTSLGRITSVRDISGFISADIVNKPLQFDLEYASDTENRCVTSFGNNRCGVRYTMQVQNLTENDIGDTIGDVNLTEVTSNTQINTSFSVTTAGTAAFSYNNTQTMTISPLLGKSCQGNQRALIGITDNANNLSLWQVELTPTQP